MRIIKSCRGGMLLQRFWMESLVDGQRFAPAYLHNLHGSATSQANGVARGGKSNETPVLSVTAGQDLTSDRYTG